VEAALTGATGAGRIEGDVVEHALRGLRVGAAKPVEHDTASTG